jgi:hypothetical protein
MDSHERLGHTEVTLQIDGLPESEVRLSEKCTRLLEEVFGNASRNADWCGTDQPLRAAPILKPPALPGDIYWMPQ